MTTNNQNECNPPTNKQLKNIIKQMENEQPHPTVAIGGPNEVKAWKKIKPYERKKMTNQNEWNEQMKIIIINTIDGNLLNTTEKKADYIMRQLDVNQAYFHHQSVTKTAREIVDDLEKRKEVWSEEGRYVKGVDMWGEEYVRHAKMDWDSRNLLLSNLQQAITNKYGLGKD